MTQTWSPSGYAHHAAFVPALGAAILEKLAPVAGERILDLGCGDGSLTERLIERGARVVGIDASPEMVAAARARGIDAQVMDATALTFENEFDAVFSNAVLHWIHDQDAVLTGVARALVPGGRFVAEFGGFTNIAAISVALRAVLGHRRIPYTAIGITRHRRLTARCSSGTVSTVELATLVPSSNAASDRHGRLAAHVRSGRVQRGARRSARGRRAEIIELLRPSMCDEAGNWTADYVRLQVIGRKPG